ncbi:hypothetical protein ACI3KY_16210 [Microbacterium sp. ZW T2_14]|uniref:hypothetical protein n=1 Tax=Microbacterium sp. ZW T2_14 TaxID=3378079 RepID=UPI0038552E41
MDVEAGRRQAGADGVPLLLGHVGGAVQRDGVRGFGVRRQGATDAGEESCGSRGIGGTQGLRKGHERAVGDAALEFPEDTLLPRLGIIEDRDRF